MSNRVLKKEPEINRPIDWPEIQYAIAEQRDEKAYRELFFHFHSDLLYFSQSLLLEKQAAEDAVADTFVSIWTMEKKLLSVNNIKTYLYRAVKNNALNSIAKRKLLHDFTLASESPIYSYTPEHQLISKETIQSIEEAISALPAKTKTVFVLIRENGCSYKEAAEIMEISSNTVDRHMQIALSKIQKSLSKTII